MLENRVKVIPAALVPESVARDGQSVNFAAESTEQYWAFRVVPDEDIIDGMEVHKVPTLSLADVQVLRPPTLRHTLQFLGIVYV